MSADAGMSSRDYEREAEASRHRLAGNLRELNDRLSPGQVFDEVLSYARGGGGSFLSALSSAAKDNPVPSLLIGAGLLMFLSEKTGLSHMMQGRSDSRTDAYRGNGDAYGGRYSDSRYGGDYRDNQGPGMAQSVASGMRDAAGNVREGARNAAGQVAGTARKGMEGVGAAVAGAAQGARNAAANVGSGMADAGSGLANAADRLRQQAQGVGGTVRDKAMDMGGSVRDTAGALGGTVRDTAGAIGGTVRDAAGAFGDRVAATAHDAPRRVAETANQAKDSMNRLVAEQPLIVGALGLAIGAAIAASLPKTEVEDEFMGEASDNLKQAVGALANEQMATAGTLAAKVATDVVGDISQVAERQGVTPQAAASVVRNATDKIKEAVGLPPSETKPGDQTKGQKSTTP